jgi:hypothetical protein
MTTASSTFALTANFDTADSCGRNRRALRMNAAVMQKARELFPNKTALHLVELTGYSQRAVEAWLSGEAKLPADALAMILKSEVGLDFLKVLMAESPASWWRKLAAYFATISAVKLQKAARRKMQEAMDADGELTAGAEALLHQDQHFYQPHVDAARVGARASRGPAVRRVRGAS